MKGIFSFCLLLIGFTILHAQAPLSFNYQAVARDAGGHVIIGPIAARFKLHEDNAQGMIRYVETHTTTTNDQGIFNLQVGKGSVINGSMSTIDWAHHSYFIETEIKTNSSADFISMGTTPLLSVPYALYAAQSGNTLDAGEGIEIQNNTITNTGDLSSTNELQTLDVNGNQLSISNGNTVTLPTGTTYTEGAGIDINGNTISANDISATNEIQTLSINGNQLSLSNGGGSVQLPAGNTSWTNTGNVTHNNPTTTDVAIGADFNGNSKLNVIATGAEHGGNFTSPGAGDALHSYCNGTGAGIRASSLNGPGAVITTGAGDAGQFISNSGKAGSFISTSGTAGYFSSTNGDGLIVEHGAVGIGTTNPTRLLELVGGAMQVTGPTSPPGYAIPIIEAKASQNSICFFGDQFGLEPVGFFASHGGYGLVLSDVSSGGKGTGIKMTNNTTDWNVYVDPAKDINFANAGTLRAWIYDTDGSYHQSSDMRLKKDIQPFNHVLDGISQLQAYTYHMKDAPEDAPISVGFMAQDVEKQFPQLVDEKNGYKSLCYDHFAVLSVEAIKEQQNEIKNLEDKVSKLEDELAEVKELLKKGR